MNRYLTDVWTEIAAAHMPVLIYGMGNGADKIMKELDRLGIPVHGVIASDDFVRGQFFHGFPVRKLSDFSNEHCMILMAFGSQRPEVIAHILRLAQIHMVRCPDVPVYGETLFNATFVHAHQKELETVHDLLADDRSKKVLENIIHFKLTGKLPYLTDSFSEKGEAMRLLELGQNESYLDLGAYRGDTIQEFLHCTKGHYRHITALEPDRKTYQKLKAYAATMHDTQLWNMGIWDRDDTLSFNASLGRGSSLQAGGSQLLAVTKIDTLYRIQHVSYIKMDVEGAEKQALLGGIHTIQRDKPKLNIALYHRSEDLFTLPLFIHEICPDYRLYLRQHPHIPAWDLNLYATATPCKSL